MLVETRRGRELLGMPVYAMQEGKRLGEITALLVRPVDSTVAAVGIGKGSLGKTHYLPFSGLKVIGVDAVMVESQAVAQDELPANAVRELDMGLPGRAVLTNSGQRLGTITGFRVHVTDGRIETYRIRPEAGMLARLAALVKDDTLEIPTGLVRSLGKDALIVADEAVALGQAPGAENAPSTPSPPVA